MSKTKEKSSVNIAELQVIIQTQQGKIDELEQQIERMTEMFLNAQRARFGQSSEKTTYVSPEQMRLFDEVETTQDMKVAEPTVETFTIEENGERKKKRTIDELTANLPVEEVVIKLADHKIFCNECGKPLKLIGKKFARHALQMIPCLVKLLKYYTCSYECPSCDAKNGDSYITSTIAPKALMKHSLASPSTVADVMTKKYVDGLPLARQEKIWKREGIELSRATLANWVIQCAQRWLKPLYRHMKHTLLTSSVIYADETVIQVLKEDGKSATSESRMWIYGSELRGGRSIRCFEYQPDRKGKHAECFLKQYSGCLVTDGYAGYNKVQGVARCGCWAHMRRKWRDAMPKGATMANSKAAVGYNYCNKLFAVEKKYADEISLIRKSARQVMVEPLLEEYFLWVKTLNPTAGSKLAEAVTYALNQKPYLLQFLNYGEVEISNNFAENAIRPFTIGRKNWLFCDTVKGAESSAIVYTMVETAKANGIEPYAYLLHVLNKMPYCDTSPSSKQLEALMPWNFKIQ